MRDGRDDDLRQTGRECPSGQERSELSVGSSGPNSQCGRVSGECHLANLLPEPKIIHEKCVKSGARAATDCSAGLRSAFWAVPDSAPSFVRAFWRRR